MLKEPFEREVIEGLFHDKEAIDVMVTHLLTDDSETSSLAGALDVLEGTNRTSAVSLDDVKLSVKEQEDRHVITKKPLLMNYFLTVKGKVSLYKAVKQIKLEYTVRGPPSSKTIALKKMIDVVTSEVRELKYVDRYSHSIEGGLQIEDP